MSSFKNFSSMLNDLQQQADGRGTLDGSAIEDFLSIAGYEEPAGGGGGGGGGDFSTAEVTIIGYEDVVGFTTPRMPILTDDGIILETIQREATATYTIALYKGSAICILGWNELMASSGSVEEDEDENMVVTGDCSLTVKPVD